MLEQVLNSLLAQFQKDEDLSFGDSKTLPSLSQACDIQGESLHVEAGVLTVYFGCSLAFDLQICAICFNNCYRLHQSLRLFFSVVSDILEMMHSDCDISM